MTTVLPQQENPLEHGIYDDTSSYNVDKVVQSVTNASKRLSQISTNTNNSNKKRKSQNRIGPWKLGRTLGRGSTGRVRLAKNINTGKLAAIKIVPKSNFKKLENPKYKNLNGTLPYGIEREIVIMKLINHPNIMGLYDVWENRNDLYLILEYIEGGELFDYLIKRGKLQEFEAINYFKQIINGINYLHQFNICHRDLKPENLLLDFNKNIKIADFGMAALEMNEKLLETSCGSPHYASPEIVAGKNYHGAPSDIWSCGIILFALLTGHLPFDDENIRKLLLKVQNGKFIMPANLSWEAKDLISRMLKVEPDDRIKISDILSHPLLTKYPDAKGSTGLVDYSNIHIKPIESSSKIDKEILKNLSVLFHNCDETVLVSKLMSSENTSEKVFYYLLMKYRNDHIDDNIDDFNVSDNSPKVVKSSSKRVLNNITNNSFKASNSFKNSTSFKGSNSFKASTSFNKKKSMKFSENITISRTSLKTTKSSKSLPKLTRKLTGNELAQMTQMIDFDSDKENRTNQPVNPNQLKTQSKSQSIKSKPKMSSMERHERQLASRVHEINEARELRYKKEEETLVKEQQKQQQILQEREQKQHKEQQEKLKELDALKARQSQAIDRLSKHKSQLDFSALSNKENYVPHSQPVSPKRRNATEPIPAKSASSLDPRIAGINSLLRAKSLASPSSYASIRKTGMNDNTTKVLQKLGIEIQPTLKTTVKTSSSKRLSNYIDNKERVSLSEFNKLEHPTQSEPQPSEPVRTVEPIGPSTQMKYKSLLSNIVESPVQSGPNGKKEDLKPPVSKLPDTPLKSSKQRKPLKTKTANDKIVPNKTIITSNVNVINNTNPKTVTKPVNERKSLIPNPRFSRFSFNGLLNQFDPDTEIYNNVQSSGTVIKKNKSQLKKSSTINLKGLGIGKDEFVSVALSEDEDVSNNYTTLLKNAISDDEMENDFYSNSDFQSDLISSRTALIGKVSNKRPSLITERPETHSEAHSEAQSESHSQSDESTLRQHVLDNSSLEDTINIENGSEFELSGYKDQSGTFDQSGAFEQLSYGGSVSVGSVETVQNDLDTPLESDVSEHVLEEQEDFGPTGRKYSIGASTRASGRVSRASARAPVAPIAPVASASERNSVTPVASVAPVAVKSSDVRASAPVGSSGPAESSALGSPVTSPNIPGSYSATLPLPIPVSVDEVTKPVEIVPARPGNTTVFRRISLKPRREAPKAPTPGPDSGEPKENWFMKIIHSLGSSNPDKKIVTINSELSSTELLQIIKTTLQLKQIEGSLTHFDIDEEFGIIDGVVPSNFGNGRKLKFKIEIIDLVDKSCLNLIKVKGSGKSFKNLIKIVSFIIKQNEGKRVYES